MKNILITGAGSYIGRQLADYMSRWPESYHVEAISQRGDDWRQCDFSAFDALVHLTGVAHIRETAENAHLYTEVNRDLAVETAQKAKTAGVKQFLFMSSMSVYGRIEGVITADTVPAPDTNYGRSKWQAEQRIAALASENFAVTILRPPMVYGEGCKGNYQTLVKLARIAPMLPAYENRRSLVSIETLCSALRERIDACDSGVFFPQEDEHICTGRMMQQIAADMGRNLRRTKLLDPAVRLLKAVSVKGRKAFGDLVYEDLRFLPLPQAENGDEP